MSKGYPVSYFTYGQAILDSTLATKIVSESSKRSGILVTNMSNVEIFFGDASISTTTGLYLLGMKGAGIAIPTTAEVWAIAAAGTPTISWMEVYDYMRTI